MDLAEKVARDAGSVTVGDIEAIRECGLVDAEILDVVLVAARTLLLQQDTGRTRRRAGQSVYLSMEPTLRSQLTVGRPTAEA